MDKNLDLLCGILLLYTSVPADPRKLLFWFRVCHSFVVLKILFWQVLCKYSCLGYTFRVFLIYNIYTIKFNILKYNYSGSETTERLNWTELIVGLRLPHGLSSRESTWNAGDAGRRLAFSSGLGRSPGKRKWQPIPVLLPEKSQSMGLGSQKTWLGN